MHSFLEKIYKAINPDIDPNLQHAASEYKSHLPLLWLLGKTGAGKSSIVQVLTGCTEAEVGNGFSPCTQTSKKFDYPQKHPVMRFLDTRGLDEAGYDPKEDLAQAERVSSAILLVINHEDAQQESIYSTLEKLKERSKLPLLLVCTHCNQFTTEQRIRIAEHHKKSIDAIWHEPVNMVLVDFNEECEKQIGWIELQDGIVDLMPVLHWIREKGLQEDQEQKNFQRIKEEVLWYAGVAATTDAIPAVGMVAVPSVQGKMLHSLAARYGIEWDRKRFMEFTAALGSGAIIQYAGSLGARQIVKMIPVFGQTVGAAASAVIGFASTYALGRAASFYLYKLSHSESFEPEELKAFYHEALRRGRVMSRE